MEVQFARNPAGPFSHVRVCCLFRNLEAIGLVLYNVATAIGPLCRRTPRLWPLVDSSSQYLAASAFAGSDQSPVDMRSIASRPSRLFPSKITHRLIGSAHQSWKFQIVSLSRDGCERRQRMVLSCRVQYMYIAVHNFVQQFACTTYVPHFALLCTLVLSCCRIAS